MAERSYWTKRRKLKRRVSLHLEYINNYAQAKSQNQREEGSSHSSYSSAHDESPNVRQIMLNNQRSDEQINISPEPSVIEYDYSCDELHPIPEPNVTGYDSSCGINENDNVPSFEEYDSSESKNSEVDHRPMLARLGKWAVKFQIPHNAVNSLLDILHDYHPNIPKDARTLLKTPRHYDVKEISGGSYYHFGIEKYHF